MAAEVCDFLLKIPADVIPALFPKRPCADSDLFIKGLKVILKNKIPPYGPHFLTSAHKFLSLELVLPYQVVSLPALQQMAHFRFKHADSVSDD